MFWGKVTSFRCGNDTPVVNTSSGDVRGFELNGIYNFRGIPYAKAERFMPPEPADSWEGIRDAVEFGHVCPLLSKPFIMGDFNCPHRYWPSDEQCLNLNIWTGGLKAEEKKPVVVWLHGGAFMDGSSIEQFAYDGDNLARDGEIVVVSVNHRLNVLGFCDLSSFGEKYKFSGIAGMMDIVAALRWVHNNIAVFGGDPENVTIMGQSGGGGKVMTLMQMPSADGLYNKAIIQSGVIPDLMLCKEKAVKQGELIAAAAGGISGLEAMEYDEIASVIHGLMENGNYIEWGPSPVEGVYEGDCFSAGFRRETSEIPVIVGSTLAEFTFGASERGNHNFTDEEKKENLLWKYGSAGDEVQRLFREAYPEIDDYYALQVDSKFRVPAVMYADKRSHEAGGSVYNYIFAFEADFKGGLMAPHCSEIPFVFRNAMSMPHCWSGDDTTERLQNEMSSAWISFIKTGRPDIPGHIWEPWNEKTRPCVVFGKETAVKYNHDGELVKLVAEKGRPPRPGEEPPIQH